MSIGQDLSALVSSRICHDLISPIGAIGNGVELVGAIGGGASPELRLIGDSAESATAKLRMFRIAFGHARAGAQLAPAEVAAAAAAIAGTRLQISVGTGGDDVPRIVAKGLMLTLLCVETCLPLGGQCTATVATGGFRVVTEAPRLRERDMLWALAEGGIAQQDVAPAEVQFLLLGQLLTSAGARIARRVQDTRIEVSVNDLTG